MARRRVTTALAAVAVLVSTPLLSGCAIGFEASTSQQRPSGNGASANAGALQVRGLTLVEGPDGSNTGTLVMTVVNTGTDPDALLGAAILAPPGAGKAVILGTQTAGGSLPLPRLSRTLIGYNSDIHVDVTGLKVTPTQFTSVELQFENAGRVVVPVMSVLPLGIYAGITPLPVATT